MPGEQYKKREIRKVVRIDITSKKKKTKLRKFQSIKKKERKYEDKEKKSEGKTRPSKESNKKQTKKCEKRKYLGSMVRRNFTGD